MAEREQFTVEMEVTPEKSHKTATLRGKHTLLSDEPKWLPSGLAGEDSHPAPVDYLMMSLASCQVSVLKQCLERNDIEEYRIECDAILDGFDRAKDIPDYMPPHTAVRIGHITVEIVLWTTPEYEDAADECLTVYDDGCIVGQSIAGGIDYTPLTALEVSDTI